MDEIQRQIKASALNQIKIGLWIYFLLLIFEGALRKWIFPGFATPLLVVRDPIALWLIFMCIKHRLFSFELSLIGIVAISLISIFLTLFTGHGDVTVMLYGLRIFIIHFPVIFVFAAVFNRKDVILIGKALLWICIPMTLLVAAQFYSPQTAWVNIGVGGEGSAGFTGALDYFRPSGTFSFTNGNSLFFALVANFVCYFLIDNRGVSTWLLYISAFCLIVAIPLAISRSLVFQSVVFVFFTCIGVMNKPAQFRSMLVAIFAVVVIFVLLSQTAFFETSINVFMARFESANKTEGGLEGVLLDRYLGGLVGALTTGSDIPFWGYGLGMGTNAGSQLLTGGRIFLISEGEWGRVIGEFGPFFGLCIILLRLELAVEVTLKSIRKLSLGDSLPFILLANCLLNLPQGQWAQPTSLGFAVVATGLTLASLRTSNE